MSKATKKKELSPALYDVVQSPIVTEKSQSGVEHNKFTFKVSPCATKDKIKQAIEGIFDVSVKKVNIVVVKGKNKVFRGTAGRRKDVKKAVVTLAEGQTIDIAAKV